MIGQYIKTKEHKLAIDGSSRRLSSFAAGVGAVCRCAAGKFGSASIRRKHLRVASLIAELRVTCLVLAPVVSSITRASINLVELLPVTRIPWGVRGVTTLWKLDLGPGC